MMTETTHGMNKRKRKEMKEEKKKHNNKHTVTLITLLTREKRLGLVNRLEFNCQLNIGYHCGRSQRRNNVWEIYF